MDVTYTTSNGNKIRAFLWSDLLEEKPYREMIEVNPIYDGRVGKTVRKNIHIDENGAYFFWNKEKIYVKNFEFDSVKTLVNKINCLLGSDKKWLIRDDDIWATMMRDTDNVGIIVDLPVYEFIIPQIGIGFTGDKEQKVLCVPTEKQYTKDKWGYKITVECECVDLRSYIPCHHFYFSDFCSMVRDGYIQIVDLGSYKNEILAKKDMREKENAKFTNRMARFFGINKEDEKLPLVSL